MGIGYKTGKGPGVVVLQEWWGLVPHIKDVCDRVAAQGFTALAPDLYHGKATTHPDDAGRMMMALNIDQAAKDLQAAIDELGGAKVGVIGFCMGGQLALYSASKSPTVAVCVDFYGIHPNVKPDYKAIKCPVVGHFGRKDAFVSEDSARKLESELKAAGVKTDFHFYDAGHAFYNDSRPEAYETKSAKLAWDRTIAALKANLG